MRHIGINVIKDVTDTPKGNVETCEPAVDPKDNFSDHVDNDKRQTSIAYPQSLRRLIFLSSYLYVFIVDMV